MDVKRILVNSEIYMGHPKGHGLKICKLLKFSYGLKQTPKQ